MQSNLPSSASPASCPACGRYTGPALTCPYCEIDLPNRSVLKLLRWTACLFAFIGLITLLVIARRHPPAVTPIAHITPAHTERTCVRGTTVTTPRVIAQDGIPRYISFELDDGSGRITIAATRHVARTLIANNNLPEKGATIEVTGSPRVDRNQQLRLYMDSPLTLCSTRSAPKREPAQ